MANYWYVDINSNNLTAEAASEILKYTGENHLIRNFSYNHGNYVDGKFGGELHMNTRGLPNIISILEKYGITEEEMKWEDEFDAVYNHMNDKPVVFLSELLDLSNIENDYAFGSIQKSETNWELILIHSPKLGYTEIHYDDYKMCRVKSFSYGEEGLLIDLEPLPDFVLNNTEAPDYRWEE